MALIDLEVNILAYSWAKCLKDSSKPVRSRDHSRFLDVPGRIYTAKKQCEVLLRDKDAVIAPSQQLSEICYNLQCKTPHRSGFYFAGPALDGTPCGSGKYCYGGHCSSRQLPKPVQVTPGGWSSWMKSSCSSGCLSNAKGIQMSTRECNNPPPKNTDQGCEGTNRQFNFCKDDK
ncbi:A disintegrin and metalloproteinase with thrombospondin motifs 5-like, partial [Sitophilus oryzae]|uniref:A disintegrin and metalloproteinase with thrombospondin motifs 5-like n=1 Tax=Sitophilus oryzae TaxID=7048 RepID=A0A6J2Y585_SITOR